MTVSSVSTKSLCGFALLVPVVIGAYWGVGRWDLWDRPAEAPPMLAPTPLAAIAPPLFLPQAVGDAESRVGVAGITSPILRRPFEAALDDSERVIGVELDGESRAYVVKAFKLSARGRLEDAGVQVVYDYLGRRPICVTHCDRSQATRVFTGDESPFDFSPTFDVRVGEGEDGLVLVVNGIRYPQLSPEIPLEEVKFVTTTWGRWRSAHPDSLVYLRS